MTTQQDDLFDLYVKTALERDKLRVSGLDQAAEIRALKSQIQDLSNFSGRRYAQQELIKIRDILGMKDGVGAASDVVAQLVGDQEESW